MALETGEYGSQIKSTRKELNNLLLGKSITIDNNFQGVTFKTKGSNITLTPKDLSHGELKKLSIYIWLKARTLDDSIILMDEVDMGLHPIWQHELHDDLQRWSKGNQYIIATHSPQIISKSHFKNLVVNELPRGRAIEVSSGKNLFLVL
jgi:predicted ATP-binding protein involved in virulence